MHYSETAVCHPMVDLQATVNATQLFFYSDASANKSLGLRAVFEHRWISAQWAPGYINSSKSTIEYLELLALTAVILTWGELICDQRIVLFVIIWL